MTKMCEMKCKLSEIKNLHICHLMEGVPSLNPFLIECMPACLSTLSVNNDCTNVNANADSSCIGLKSAISKVTNEVFLNSLKMSGSTFENIVKAASNSDRLIFSLCTIGSLSQLDLTGPETYR